MEYIKEEAWTSVGKEVPETKESHLLSYTTGGRPTILGISNFICKFFFFFHPWFFFFFFSHMWYLPNQQKKDRKKEK